jgi:hypothetical protein
MMLISTSNITFTEGPLTFQNAHCVFPAAFIWRVSRLSFPFLGRLCIVTDLSDHTVSSFNHSTHLQGHLNFHSCAPVARILPTNILSRLNLTAYNGPSLTVPLIPLLQLPITGSYQVVSRLTYRGT